MKIEPKYKIGQEIFHIIHTDINHADVIESGTIDAYAIFYYTDDIEIKYLINGNWISEYWIRDNIHAYLSE
jgi:hypothetical protein